MSVETPEGTRYRFRKLTFFASCGMVRIIDDSNGEDKYESPMDMRLRAKAFAQEAEYMRQKGDHYDDERRELLKAARDCIMAVQEAERQGCPLDPRVAREQAQLRRKVWAAMGGQSVPGSGSGSGSGLILPGQPTAPAHKLIV